MKELSDEKLFEYLMTSDLIESYKPSEWKFLLLKFRYFYKILRGNKEREIENKEDEIIKLKNRIESLEKKISEEQIKSSNLKNKIDLAKKVRKLTWKERLKGEAKTFEDNDQITN